MTLAFALGSPAAVIAAVAATAVALMTVGRGSLAVFGFQRTKIDELLDEIADLKKDAVSKTSRIEELERVVAATQLLPVAGFGPVLEAFALHETRAAERHAELQREHAKLIGLADGMLRIQQDMAARYGEEPA